MPVKNCWTIAEHAGDDGLDGPRDLIGRANWHDALVRTDVQDLAATRLGRSDAVLLVDETVDHQHRVRVIEPANRYSPVTAT